MILKTLEVSIESMICPVSSIGGRGGGELSPACY